MLLQRHERGIHVVWNTPPCRALTGLASWAVARVVYRFGAELDRGRARGARRDQFLRADHEHGRGGLLRGLPAHRPGRDSRRPGRIGRRAGRQGAAARGWLVDPPALGSRALEPCTRGRAEVRRARRGQPGRDRPGEHPRVPPAIRARARPGTGGPDASAGCFRYSVGRAGGPADRARRARAWSWRGVPAGQRCPDRRGHVLRRGDTAARHRRDRSARRLPHRDGAAGIRARRPAGGARPRPCRGRRRAPQAARPGRCLPGGRIGGPAVRRPAADRSQPGMDAGHPQGPGAVLPAVTGGRRDQRRAAAGPTGARCPGRCRTAWARGRRWSRRPGRCPGCGRSAGTPRRRPGA